MCKLAPSEQKVLRSALSYTIRWGGETLHRSVKGLRVWGLGESSNPKPQTLRALGIVLRVDHAHVPYAERTEQISDSKYEPLQNRRQPHKLIYIRMFSVETQMSTPTLRSGLLQNSVQRLR